MHLGLIAKAKKDLLQKKQRYAKILARTRARSKSPDRRPHTAVLLSPAAEVDRLINRVGSSAELTSTQRPHSSSGAKSMVQSKTAQRLHLAVDRIDSVGDLIDAQVAALSQEMRASTEGGWNSTTNDNIINSSHNNKGTHARPRSAFSKGPEMTPQYKRVYDKVVKEKTRPKSATGTSATAGTTSGASHRKGTHKYVEVSSPAVKKEFTLFDAKERVNVTAKYPPGSFGNKTGDLIDFQALAVELSQQQGRGKSRSPTYSLSPSKAQAVFPGVENGAQWTHFPVNETLTRVYSEKDNLVSSKHNLSKPHHTDRSQSKRKGNTTTSNSNSSGCEGKASESSPLPEMHRKAVSFDAENGVATAGFQGVGAIPRTRNIPPALEPIVEPLPALPSIASPRSAAAVVLGHDLHSPTRHHLTDQHTRDKKHPHLLVDTDLLDTSAQAEDLPLNTTTDLTTAATVQSPTDAEQRAMENLDDVEDGLEDHPQHQLLPAVERTPSSASSLGEHGAEATFQSIRGLKLKSHAGLETRSVNIISRLEAAPRLVGYTCDDPAAISELTIPETYEISVFDVGYVLPCSNSTLEFTTAQSKHNSEIILPSNRLRMQAISGRRLSHADSLQQLLALDAEGEPAFFASAVIDHALEKGTSTKFPRSSAPQSTKSQSPWTPLGHTEDSRRDPALDTTYGVLIEVCAQPVRSRRTSIHLPGSPHSSTHSPTVRSRKDPLPQFSPAHSANFNMTDYAYAYKLVPLRELLDIAIKSCNEEMTSLYSEMLSFAYKFGDANNHQADSKELRARKLHQSQSEKVKFLPDVVFFEDQKEVIIHPGLLHMLDRSSKRAFTQLIRSNIEVLFNTDEEQVTIGIKY